jgi:hypothetical protein
MRFNPAAPRGARRPAVRISALSFLKLHLLAPVLPDTKKPAAVSRPGAQPTGAIKKPIAGRPGIGAQFVSFNFRIL